MILHIIPDDKFIDIAYRLFEDVYPNNNQYVIISKENHFKYVNSIPLKAIKLSEIISPKYIQSLSNYSLIILHRLDTAKVRFINHLSNNVKILWIGWGFDYSQYIYPDDKIILPKTTQLMNYIKRNNKVDYKQIIKERIKTILYGKANINDAFAKINYFAPVLYEEYDHMRNIIPNFKPKYIDWNYGTLEDDYLVNNISIQNTYKNILIGNSATPSNNHIEALDYINTYEIQFDKIICPLSYGDNDYAFHIVRIGREMFADKFYPLTTYISRPEYNKIISSCSNVIMNHIRQQALGNIITMMYNGSKIYFNSSSLVYSHYKRQGAFIYTLNELISEYKDCLTMEQIEINRQILKSEWSKEKIYKKTEEIIKL